MWAGIIAATLFVLPASSPPNVVFLSVDTLRADHLGCYGYQRDTSPNIDRLAARGLVFEDCVCEVPLTNPSFGSMLSSRYPRMTGTTRNGLPMPAGVPLVTEAFRAAGYETACIQSNWTLKGKLCGLDRGFERYDDDFDKRRWGFLVAERRADEVTRLALQWLSTRDNNRPFFAWIHYSDPHQPYKYRRQYNPWGEPLRYWHEPDKTRVRYDSEVAFMDHHLGAVLNALPGENTYVLLVSDHGESLHEHDYVGHGRRVYQPGLHIPLIIAGPGVEPGRRGVKARGLDVGPTLLGLAGLAGLPGMLGRDLVKEEIPETRPRIVETYGGAVPQIPGVKSLLKHTPPMQQGILAGEWKLVVMGPYEELYNLRKDPAETNDLSRELPEKTADLERRIKTWSRTIERGASQPALLNANDIEALEAAGYL